MLLAGNDANASSSFNLCIIKESLPHSHITNSRITFTEVNTTMLE